MDVTSSTNYDEAIRAFDLGKRFLREKEYERSLKFLRRAYALHQPPLEGLHQSLVQAENELKQSPLYCHTCYRYRNNCVCSSTSTPTNSTASSSSSSTYFSANPTSTSSQSTSNDYSSSTRSNPSSSSSSTFPSLSPLSIISSLPSWLLITVDKVGEFLWHCWARWINFWTPFVRKIGFTSTDRIKIVIQGFSILFFLALFRLWLGHGILITPLSSSSESLITRSSLNGGNNNNEITAVSTDSSDPRDITNTHSRTTMLPSRRFYSPFSTWGDLQYSHTFGNGSNIVIFSPFGSMFITMIIVNVIGYFFRQRQQL